MTAPHRWHLKYLWVLRSCHLRFVRLKPPVNLLFCFRYQARSFWRFAMFFEYILTLDQMIAANASQ